MRLIDAPYPADEAPAMRLRVPFRLFLLVAVLASSVAATIAIWARLDEVGGRPEASNHHRIMAAQFRRLADDCEEMAKAEDDPDRWLGLRREAEEWRERAADHERQMHRYDPVE